MSDRFEQRSPLGGQRVEDHPSLSPGGNEPGLTERAEVVRNEGLRAAEDPGEIAAAQLLSGSEREQDAQPCRISESASPLDSLSHCWCLGQLLAHTLGCVKIEAEKVAGVVSCHAPILTIV